MALELQQNLRLQQQLVMTPQLQMAIKLLQLSRIELVETIQQELETNPTLEEEQEPETDGEPNEEPQAAEEQAPQEISIDEEKFDDKKFDEIVDWQNYLDEFNSTGKLNIETEKKESPDYEAFTASKTSLSDHLRWQLLMTKPTETEELIGSYIIGCIDEDGYLETGIEDIADMAETSVEK